MAAHRSITTGDRRCVVVLTKAVASAPESADYKTARYRDWPCLKVWVAKPGKD